MCIVQIFNIHFTLSFVPKGNETISLEEIDKKWESDYRLPQTTLPLHYDLYLFPNLEDDTFNGSVAISLDTKEPRDHFVVHVKNLNISDTQLKVLEQN